MQIYSHYLSAAQALNATNYPANCAFHMVPPSIQPTEFGGVGAYFGVAMAEIHSAAYSTDNMGYLLQGTTDPVTGQYKVGLDVYKDTPTGVQFVGSVYTGLTVFASASGAGGCYAFAGKWLGVIGAIDQSDNRAKMLIVNCETMQLNYYPLPDGLSGYGVIGNRAIYIDGEPYIGITRPGGGSQSWTMDFYRCSDGQFFSGVGVSAAHACYGEYIISHYSGSVYVTKMRTNTYPGYQYPVVEADPALTSSTPAASGNVYDGMMLAPLDGSYVFNDAREGKLFTLDPATAQGSFGPSVNNNILSSHWGSAYYTGQNHQYPDYILQNGCPGYNYGPKAGFFLFNIHDPMAPANSNGNGGYDLTAPYFGRQCATHLMQQSTPATPANLTTIPVKYSGLVSLHRGLLSWNAAESKVDQFGIVDWQRPTTWAEAMASSHCPWFFDAATPVSQIRNDTLFTLEYKVPTTGTSAWVLKNRHPVGLHAPHAVDVAPGTKLRVYALVESDTDLNHGFFMAYDFGYTGTWRNPNDKRASGLYENDYGMGIVFLGQRATGGSLNAAGILGALSIDAVIYLNSAYGGLSPVGVTLQEFLDELNTSAVVENESAFFSDWQNRAAKSYVDLTFTVDTAVGYVFVLIEVYKAGVLVTSANFNTYVTWNYYNTDFSWNSENTFILSIGSACTNQPLVVEPLVTPKPFALRV